ncbi:MAG: phosphate ABC transporter, permease protein PstA [Hyphomicrobium sp. 32-62-53]|nr:MAG: phosphate ABC transporter, permease protein PstA [Hyphomicrobium sp. 12-62-95]OYX98713.1 MAG: phosphate ABC transporter, permease protein PstA [Hyphomicrobium sp. 32-62-53]
MTDITAGGVSPPIRRVEFDTAESKARLRGRYRSEARFKAYGIAALAVAAAFLIALLSSIVMRGIPGFFQHYLVADVLVDAAKIDPEGKGDAATLRAGDYTAVARAALADAIPGVEGRQLKRELNGLLSSGAGDALREMVVADPSLVGQRVRAPLLLADEADVFLKDSGTKIRVLTDTRGVASPSATTGDVTILVGANDFADDVALVKAELKALAEGIDETVARRKARGATVESLADLEKEAADLRRRYEAAATSETLDTKTASRLVGINGGLVKVKEMTPTLVKGEVIIPLKSTADAAPGTWDIRVYETPESNRNLNDRGVAFLEELKAKGLIESQFNFAFFTRGDSREAELAGIQGALVGSILTLLVTIGLCLPIGVLAAIYLEEFAPKNRITELIEININNLAAVPSIVFGLLGLAVFLNFFGMPRSAPLVGGLVLALLVLPTIIIASRAALKSVPPSIREAALGIGASKQQAVFHHVLPLAMPGIMTGTIIGMAHALGETAPLLMIGMIAFIVDVPSSLTQAATVLPVQIFLWSDLPEPAFKMKTAAAIMVLLAVLFVMNGLAIWLRKKFERRW